MATDVQDSASSAPTTDQTFTPTTPADKAVVSNDVAAFREARLAERTGKEPAKPDAGSPPAEPDVQAASTDANASPASEPGKPSGHKGNLQTRKAELSTEIADLQQQLRMRAQLREELTRLAPAPHALPASQPAATADQGEPTLEQFANDDDPYASWMLARAEYRSRGLIANALYQEHAQAQRVVVERQFEQRKTQYQTRLAEAQEADPALAARAKIEQFDFVPSSRLPAGTSPNVQTDLAEGIFNAEHPVVVMAHLSDHPEVLSRLLASPTPQEFWRQFGQVERDVQPTVTSRPQKTITDAPRPPRTVGTRTEPLDEVEAAVRSDDVAAFRQARLRQRTAARR